MDFWIRKYTELGIKFEYIEITEAAVLTNKGNTTIGQTYIPYKFIQ